ncbi:hypothetical protein [Microbacterium lacusdiani]
MYRKVHCARQARADADTLRRTSAGGAYARVADRVATTLEETSGPGARTSDPAVIARTIVRAATARRPRTRYLVGFGAAPAVLLRRVLPDRAFDAVIRRVFRV